MRSTGMTRVRVSDTMGNLLLDKIVRSDKTWEYKVGYSTEVELGVKREIVGVDFVAWGISVTVNK